MFAMEIERERREVQRSEEGEEESDHTEHSYEHVIQPRNLSKFEH